MSTIHALYRIYGSDDELLYVGITNNPSGRVMDHVRSKGWARRIRHITFQHFNDRETLKAAERKAIVVEGPELNKACTKAVLEEDVPESDWVLEDYEDAPA